MSVTDNVKTTITQKIKDFCSNYNLPNPSEGSGNIGIMFRVVVKAIINGEDISVNISVLMETIKTNKVIIVANYTGPATRISTNEYDTEFPKLAGIAFDQTTSNLYQKFKEFYTNNKDTNEDLNIPISFYIENINVDISVLGSSGSSGSSGTSGSSITSGSSGTSGPSGSSGILNTSNTSNISNSSNNDDFINNENITKDSGSKLASSGTSGSSTKKDDPKLVKDVNKDDPTAAKNAQKAEKLSAIVKASSLGKAIGGLGGKQPVIVINDYWFSSREIISLELSSTLFVPTLELTVKLTTGKFISRSFPKDGDVVSVFIRSFNDVFKPISNDYLITHVDTSVSNDKEGSEITIFIYGILNINYLYAEKCKAIKEKTSYESLMEIAKELKIGFASNEMNTNDKMTWICPHDTYKNWIDNITIHAYKDTTSFYDSWIDFYYILNFANLNKLYSISDKAEAKDGLMTGTWQQDYSGDDNITHTKVPHTFTNAPSAEKTNYYYNALEFINNSGEINILNGYKRYLHFYDVSKRKNYTSSKDHHDVIYVDPFVTQDVETYKTTMRGRAGEDYYKDTIKRKWQGIQYSLTGKNNVHDNWKLAEYINFQNLENIDKMLLKIHLPKVNFNVYRGQRIPLTCVISRDIERGKLAGSVGKDDYKATGFTLDRFISANNYIIMGIKIIYIQIDANDKSDVTGEFHQELILGRREWELPTSSWPINENSPYQSNTL